jgi:alkyl hydroperoxide reductase subunit AhpC
MSKSDVIANGSKLKKQYEIAGPMLVDYDGTVGKAYGAKTTPHMFVIDKEGVLRYSGAFSDHSKKNYVLGAVKAIQAGTEPKPATTKAWGCGVKYKR